MSCLPYSLHQPTESTPLRFELASGQPQGGQGEWDPHCAAQLPWHLSVGMGSHGPTAHLAGSPTLGPCCVFDKEPLPKDWPRFACGLLAWFSASPGLELSLPLPCKACKCLPPPSCCG